MDYSKFKKAELIDKLKETYNQLEELKTLKMNNASLKESLSKRDAKLLVKNKEVNDFKKLQSEKDNLENRLEQEKENSNKLKEHIKGLEKTLENSNKLKEVVEEYQYLYNTVLKDMQSSFTRAQKYEKTYLKTLTKNGGLKTFYFKVNPHTGEVQEVAKENANFSQELPKDTDVKNLVFKNGELLMLS